MRNLFSKNDPAVKLFAGALKVLAIGALALMTPGYGVVLAQTAPVPGIQVTPIRAYTLADSVTAVDTSEAVRVRYVGSLAGAATVAVAGTNSIAFVENGSADTKINAVAGPNQCGAVVGTLDLTNANCNNFGKLIDHINASPSWQAALAGVLRSDVTNTTVNNFAATDAKLPEGLAITTKTSTALFVNAVLLPGGGRLPFPNVTGQFGFPGGGGVPAGIQNWFGDKNQQAPTINKLVRAPFNDTITVLQYASENVTSTGAVGNMIAYCVFENYKSGGYGSTETALVMFQKAGSATTVTGTLNEFQTTTGLICAGGKVLYRISATTDLTVPKVFATGIRFARTPAF